MSATRTNDEPLREGDVYRWSWKPGTPEGEKFAPYWCKSRIAIVSGGRLFDTYWHSSGEEMDAGRVSLEWVANMEDLEAARSDAHEVYEPADVVDLRHPNGGGVYRRKGAKPSKRVQVEAWTRKRDKARREADYAQDRIDELLAARPATAEAST